MTCHPGMSLSALATIILVLNVVSTDPEGNVLDCDIKDFPFYVHFRHVSDDTTTLCGGSLISTRSVLTAAHCCEGRIEGNNVTVGNPASGPCAQSMPVSEVFIYPGYKAEIPDYDYCIILLTRAVILQDSANIINIPEIDELKEMLDPTKPHEESFWVIGYSESEGNLECVPTQLSAEDAVGCVEATNSTQGFNQNTMFCHYALTYLTSECVGDPGAPIVYKNMQVGLTSWAHDKHFCFDDMRVGSRLDQVLDWVTEEGHPQYGMRDGADSKTLTNVLWLVVVIAIFI